MKNLKEIARDYVKSRFNVHDSFFETAWELITSSTLEDVTEDVIHNNYPSTLGIVGEEENEAVLAIMIFADSGQRLPGDSSIESLLGVIQDAASRYEANEKLLLEILEYVKGTTGVSQKESKASICIWNNEAGSYTGPKKGELEDIDKYLSRKKEYEILIVDNGEFKSRNIGGVYLREKEVSDELSSAAYRFLVHLLKKNGDGGTSLDVAKSVWFYDSIFLGTMNEAWTAHQKRKTKSRNPFDYCDGRIKKEKSHLRRFLLKHLGIDLSVDRGNYVSHHVLDRVPTFCLLEIE